MNFSDEEMAKFVTGTWLKQVGDVPIDEVAVMVCEDPSVVTALVGALRHARKERDEAVEACREVVQRGNRIHDRTHEHEQRGQTDPQLRWDTHEFLHYCIGASHEGTACGPRAVIGKAGAK
jgi:hypothetical protein